MPSSPETQAFAERLKQALKRSPKRIETPSQLALQFNLNFAGQQVSNQAAQKWLTGHSKPTPDKIEVLAKMLNVSFQWLRYGIPEARPTSRSSVPQAMPGTMAPSAQESRLLERYRRLPEHQQSLIDDLVDQLALASEMWSAGD